MPRADPAVAYPRVVAGDAMVSETLAYPLRLREGDTLRLPSDQGEVALRVAAVVQNYSAPSGIVYLHRDRFLELFPGEPARSIAFWLAPGVTYAEAQRRIAVLPGGETMRPQPNAELRGNRTFAITALMRAVAGVVAFVAVVSALMALLEERRRVLGYLRAIGLSRRLMAWAMALEAALIACTAAFMSWGVGLAMALVLIHTVNRRAFGWTLQFLPGEGPYLSLLAVALGAALLGAIYPIVQAARLSVVATIREE
jgi:putative ABC transport system permease protein